MMSRRKIITLFVLMVSIMLILSACVRPAEDPAAATPETSDPNTSGSTDGDQAQPPAAEAGETGGDQAQPPAAEAGETGGDQAQPPAAEAGETGGDQAQPPAAEAGETGGDQAQPETSSPATGGQPEQTGGQIGTPPTEEVTHIVQPGENLFRIGLQYGYSWVVLARYNGIPNPNYIVVGQPILIPPTGGGGGGGRPPTDDNYTYYVVQPGDNLFRIGLKFGMSWMLIGEANGIVNPHYIVAGQVLKIPVLLTPDTP